MYYQHIQTRLRPSKDENGKSRVVQSNVWQTLVEFSEGDDPDEIALMYEHQLRVGAMQAKLPVEEVRKYYRIKEVYVEEDQDF